MSTRPYTEITEASKEEAALAHEDHGSHEYAAEDSPDAPAAGKWYVEGGMGKRILGVLVVVLVVGLLWYAYKQHVASQAGEGAVVVDDTSPKAIADSVSDTPVVKKPTPVQSAPAVQTSSAAPAVIPASDSIAPNPANGMTFAGTGKFQVYRQGNLTWRVDTESGRTCILFATMEEWKKPIVFEHGCANG